MARLSTAADNINLLNFETPDHQKSRYVLTSPRSLQACARLKIKPVELLPKSLQEFIDLFRGQPGQSVTSLALVYDEYERQCLCKLQAARSEREKIIAHPTPRPHPSGSSQTRTRKPQNATGGKRALSDHHSVNDRILKTLEGHLAKEKDALLLKEEFDRQWDLERRREETNIEQNQLQHQRKLAHSQKQFQLQMNRVRQVQHSIADEEKRHLLSTLQAKWDRWKSCADSQAKLCAQKLEGNRLQADMQRKTRQQRLCELQEEDNEKRREANGHWRQVEARTQNAMAASNKEAMERQMKHAAAETRHKQKKAVIEEMVRCETEGLRIKLAERDRSVEERCQMQKKQKEAHIRQTSAEQKTLQQRQAAETLQGEYEKWTREVDVCHQQNMSHADNITKKFVEERRRKAHSGRVKRETNQQEKRSLILEEERKRRLQYVEDIEMKNERSEQLAKERNKSIQKSRKTALESETLRNEVKDRYMHNSFHKMAQQALQLSAIENKPTKFTMDSRSSCSKVILG